jgi:hypothetical protein
MKLIQYECSPQLLKRKGKRTLKDKVIDWDALQPGHCYLIPIQDANIVSLTVQCSKASKVLNRKFRLYVHYDIGMVEIGRIDSISNHAAYY